MANKDIDIINEINFTKRCILMSVISKEKNMILINSFHKIPIVKLFTADSNFENFVYSKIKGAFCLFMSKERDIKNRKYYFRIYDLKDYSLLFNIEIKKEYIQYISQYKDDFYFMQLHQSFLGFQFLSKESGRVFFLLLNEDPKKEVIEQNEGSMNIKPKDLSKTLTKVIDYIKMRLKYKFESSGGASNAASGSNYRRRDASSQKKENFPIMNINDNKGEYLDTSPIPEIEELLDNIEIDTEEKNVLLFANKKLNYEKCQKIVKKYESNMDNTIRRRNQSNVPVYIIDKDCMNILNKELYTNILTKNVLNNLNAQKRLDIFKQEHKKRHKGKGIPTGAGRRKSKSRMSKVGKRDSRLSFFSKDSSERTTASDYSSNDKGRRLSYNKTPSMKFNNNNISSNIGNMGNTNNISTNVKMNAKSVDKEYKGNFTKDKMMIPTGMLASMVKEKDGQTSQNFSKNDDKKEPVNNNQMNENAKKGVDIIEERPEDEEKDRERKQYKKRIINMPDKYINNNKKNNIQTNNIQTNNYTGNNNTAANSIAAKVNIYKRTIASKSGKPGTGNFMMGMAKK